MKPERFHAEVRKLRELTDSYDDLSPAHPVSVRLEKEHSRFGDDTYATTRFDGDQYVIQVWEGYLHHGIAHVKEMLVHEWAHCLAWDHEATSSDDEHHSDSWGTAYAKLYRAFIER